MLQVKNIVKKYKTGDLIQVALDHVSLTFREHEFVAILGPSGSGKTTLLNIIGGLDRYDEGDLIINDISTKKYKDKDWDSYRNHTIGFVFQSYNLIPHSTILSNVELALTISNVSKEEKRKRAIEVLKKVGLGDQLHKKPNQLSGGQMQRVAIARALVNNPDIILADEPTGALDSKTSIQVMEILKEVSKDRLVIMVTHNPELADQYATRIINLKDGQIISDSQPINSLTINPKTQKTKKTKLKFTTALALSLSNLMTKKGRTFLTSFAGAIGIIGIALILSLSNGVNSYIKNLENEMLGSNPIQLEKETFDLTSMMDKNQSSTDTTTNSDDKIYSNNVVGDTVKSSQETIKENNLGKFKTYLDDNESTISSSLSAIEYGYSITPQVYRKDENEGLVQVSPASLETGSSNLISGSLSSAWSQLVSNEKLRQQQYELLEGEWPSHYDEVALIITDNNEVSDYTLYTLGLMDISEMNEIVEAAKNGEEYEDEQQTFQYSDVIGLEYQVFAPCQLYKESDGVYVDKSDDEDYITDHLKHGTTVKITCVLKATENAEITSGIGYDISLTEYLMDITQNNDVVKAQLQDKETNVLTGEKFDDDTDSDSASTTTSTLNTSFTALYNDISLTQSSSMALIQTENTVETNSDSDDNSIETESDSNANASDTNETNDNSTETDPNTNIDTEETQEYSVVFKNYDGSLLSEEKTYKAGETITNLPTEDPSKPSTKDYQYIFIGWKSSLNNAYYISSELPEVSESVEYTAMYYEYALPVSTTTDTTQLPQDSSDITSQIPSDITGQVSSDIDMSQFAGITGSSSVNMTDDQLEAIVAKMSDSTPSTYEDVMEALGYCTHDDPSSIDLYPVDFDSKENIENFISDYNKQVENDNDKVTYTDVIATLTSSITSIVDTITYILVAFVAISLVVSSIMIAIITYISVLERTKEIGVLRALGASKNDISKIFNAETFIEGFISGVLGILVTLLLCIPINAIVESIVQVSNIAVLPMNYSLLLILISILLTLIAGFIPARIASKKDPAIALRSE